MRFDFRSLGLAALAVLPLLATSCTEKPKATDPEKTATVVSESTMTSSDSSAVVKDSTAR